jgi:hypothetical protein
VNCPGFRNLQIPTVENNNTTCNPSIKRLRQEDYEFKATLGKTLPKKKEIDRF